MSDQDKPPGGYSRRFLERRETHTDDAAPAPFGAWYAERFRRRTGRSPAAEAAPRAPGSQRGADPQGAGREGAVQEGAEAAADAAPSDAGNPGQDAPTQANATAGDTSAAKDPDATRAPADTGSESDDTTPASREHPNTAEGIELEARGWPAAVEPRVERRLRRNARELRMVEGNLTTAAADARVIGFTSCLDGEGKTTAALNAAYGLAMRGAGRVLLLDANPGNPSLHRLFSCAPAPGLREVLAGQAAIEDALHPASLPGLHVLAAGGGWYGLGSTIPMSRMRAFVDLVRDAYDYVLIDTASLFSSSDAARIAPVLDGYALVVACEQTKWELAQSADAKIRATGSRVVGVVLNRRRYYIPRRVYEWLSR